MLVPVVSKGREGRLNLPLPEDVVMNLNKGPTLLPRSVADMFVMVGAEGVAART